MADGMTDDKPGGILQGFPDIRTLLSAQGTATLRVNDVDGLVRTMVTDPPHSPLEALSTAFQHVDAHLNIDVSGFSTQLPQTLQRIQNALPSDTIDYVRALDLAYSAAQDFLQSGTLISAMPGDVDLPTAALGAIDQAFDLFDSRLNGLVGQLIDLDTLTHIRGVFASVEEFRTDFAAHRAEFLPFITSNLIGATPDVLDVALAQRDQALAVFQPLQADPLAPPRHALANAFDDLDSAINGLDPADANGYVEIQARLTVAETAINALLDALDALYVQLGQLVDRQPWATLFSDYTARLAAIRIENTFSVDQVLDSLVAMLEELLAQFNALAGADDLTQRIRKLSQTVHTAFAGSPLGQVNQQLKAALEQIRQFIEGIPAQQARAAVEDMLTHVKQELDALGIGQISARITNAFQDVDTFVTSNINEELTKQIETALTDLAGQFQNLPLKDLPELLQGVLDKVGALIADAGRTLKGYLDDLKSFAGELEQLSFKPVSDNVIGEIDDIKRRLQAINPDALSDVEKLALRAAFAALKAIDLESAVVKGLKDEFGLAQGAFKGQLARLGDLLDQLRKKVGTLDPHQILGPVLDVLQQLSALLDQLNGAVLLKPLYDQADKWLEKLDALSPGKLLDALQAPYDAVRQVVNSLDPDEWTAPLRELYAQIEQIVTLVDVTPLFDELDQREKALFASVRTTLIEALNNLNLPEPFNAFWIEIRSLLETATDAIFSDPASELQQIGVDLRARFQLSSVFDPLDAVFDQLVVMIEAVPSDDLTEAMNRIRETIGVALEALDPAKIVSHLQDGLGQLSDLAPAALLAQPLAMPALKLRFQAKVAAAPPDRAGDVVAATAQFDAVFTLIDPAPPASRVQRLTQTHAALVNSLRTKINSLDTSAASRAYAALRAKLDQVLPDFLRQTTPLTHDKILAGIQALRPSARVAGVNQAVNQFLASLQPLEAALTPAMNEFFGNIREMVMLVNPLSLKDGIEDIYDALYDQLQSLDPDALAASLRANVFDPLADPLQAIDPKRLKAQVEETYQDAVDAVKTRVKDILDKVRNIVNEQLRAIRKELQGLLNSIQDTLTDTVNDAKTIADGVEQLVLVEWLDRLNQVADNLGVSFGAELDRVRSAFDEMLAAIPLGEGSASVTISAAVSV
jgi:methyl-accepting chemotaxis protein